MPPRPHRGHPCLTTPSVLVAAVATAFLVAVGATTSACNIGLSSSLDTAGAKGASDPSFNESDAPSDARTSLPPSALPDGTASGDASSGVRGSPLCTSSMAGYTCSPDDTTVYATACGTTTTSDGGAGDAALPKDAGAVSVTLACRVRAQGSDRRAVCAAAGSGGDGAECLRSADCHAGFECVKSPGRCRRYCCNNICDDAQTFCDAQPTATTTEAPNLLVPVCAPVRACKLLGDTCDVDQTCAVVKQDGATSCVQVGTAKAGDDCELAQCASNLTCLGQVGSRKCYRLCLVSDARVCDKGQTCRGTAPLFKDPKIGVCE